MNAPSPADAPKTIRCLVVQLARLGDTLQSLMALRAAQQLYPNLEIHFVVRERFAAAAKRISWIKEVYTLPTDALLSPILNGQKPEIQALGDIARWVAPLVKDQWDLIVNWSYSEASSYLVGLLPARGKLGYTRRLDLSFGCADGWSQYIQGVVQSGTEQNIHLTDILTTQLLTALQLHYGEPKRDGNSPVTSKTFFSIELDDDPMEREWKNPLKRWIGIQLGAANEEKTWFPEKWAGVIEILIQRHPEYQIVLMGGPEDVVRERHFMSRLRHIPEISDRVISLVGQTGFDLWASVVSRCQWIFSGDTAAIHLASVLGTRVLNISIGPVKWSETGPYGNGHYVITNKSGCKKCENPSCDLRHECGERISPEAVYATWSFAATEWTQRNRGGIESHFERSGWSRDLEKVEIYRSRIRDSDDGGGVVYEPLLFNSVRLPYWTSMVMGHVARAWYCGWVPPIGKELDRGRISPELLKEMRELEEGSSALLKVCQEAARLSLLLNQRSAGLKSDKVMPITNKEELREIGKQLVELDALIGRIGKTLPALQPFAQMSRILMHNLNGDLLADLGKESANCYRQLSDGITILRGWISHTIGLAKPVAVPADRPSLDSPQTTPKEDLTP